jgi:hypothetical protein
MAGLSRLPLFAALDAVSRLLCLAPRRFLLMRRVRMILGLEVLGLMWGTFAIPRHEFSNSQWARANTLIFLVGAAGLEPATR